MNLERFRPKISVVISPDPIIPGHFFTNRQIVKDMVENSEVDIQTGEYVQLIEDYVTDLVCEICQIEVEELKSNVRKREFVQARQLGMYLLWLFTNYSLSKIGHIFGGKDHATVLHAKKTVTNLSETNIGFNAWRETAIKVMNNSGYYIAGDDKLEYSKIENITNVDRLG